MVVLNWAAIDRSAAIVASTQKCVEVAIRLSESTFQIEGDCVNPRVANEGTTLNAERRNRRALDPRYGWAEQVLTCHRAVRCGEHDKVAAANDRNVGCQAKARKIEFAAEFYAKQAVRAGDTMVRDLPVFMVTVARLLNGGGADVLERGGMRMYQAEAEAKHDRKGNHPRPSFSP